MDNAGNGGQCNRTVTVTDETAPDLTCPADITVGAGASCDAVVNYTAVTALDNCDGSISVVQTAGQASGTDFVAGTITNTFEATDGASNVGTCSFDVTVTNDPPGEFLCDTETAMQGNVSMQTVTNISETHNNTLMWQSFILSPNDAALTTITPDIVT